MPTNSEELANPMERLTALLAQVDLVALDARAVTASAELVAKASEEDLDRPTPCEGWTFTDLLAHMTVQHYRFAAASRGETDPAGWERHPVSDNPLESYLNAADHVVAAFAEDGVLDRKFPLAEFSADFLFPGRQALSFHFVDYVVHAWDVAKTLGVSVEFDSELLEVALAVAKVVPEGEARLTPGAPFAPAVPVPGGSGLDEIVAHLGRSPSWPE